MRTLSAKFVQALQAPQTSEQILCLLDINCGGTHFYLVDDLQSVNYDGNTYQPYSFQIKLPDSVEGQTPTATLMIDAVDQTIARALQLTDPRTPPTVTVYAMLASQIGTLELPVMTFICRAAQGDAATIVMTLTITMGAGESFPAPTFNPGNFPTLFINPSVSQSTV